MSFSRTIFVSLLAILLLLASASQYPARAGWRGNYGGNRGGYGDPYGYLYQYRRGNGYGGGYGYDNVCPPYQDRRLYWNQ